MRPKGIATLLFLVLLPATVLAAADPRGVPEPGRFRRFVGLDRSAAARQTLRIIRRSDEFLAGAALRSFASDRENLRGLPVSVAVEMVSGRAAADRVAFFDRYVRANAELSLQQVSDIAREISSIDRGVADEMLRRWVGTTLPEIEEVRKAAWTMARDSEAKTRMLTDYAARLRQLAAYREESPVRDIERLLDEGIDKRAARPVLVPLLKEQAKTMSGDDVRRLLSVASDPALRFWLVSYYLRHATQAPTLAQLNLFSSRTGSAERHNTILDIYLERWGGSRSKPNPAREYVEYLRYHPQKRIPSVPTLPVARGALQIALGYRPELWQTAKVAKIRRGSAPGRASVTFAGPNFDGEFYLAWHNDGRWEVDGSMGTLRKDGEPAHLYDPDY
jgi:hypothetical protein